MRTLYLDCGMGAAGDMLAAALLELLPDREGFLREVNALGLPGVRVAGERAVKCGVTGTRLAVTVDGREEESLDHLHVHGHHHGHGHTHDHGHHRAHDHGHGHAHGHDHGHSHAHSHEHGSMAQIGRLVREVLPLSEKVRSDVEAVYGLIARAESAVHGVGVEQVHFHEVGALDAVADIAMVCMLMERIAPDEVVVSPIRVGSGQVRCAHGILPVPAPATALLLRDMPVYGGDIPGELCTPTGAALLKRFATRFGEMPALSVQAVGYGMGKKDFAAANCVRAVLGRTWTGEDGGRVAELACTVDDMTGEELGFAMERLLAGGALDVYAAPVTMKKSRPGTLLSVLCAARDVEAMYALIFRHTTTIGIRRYAVERRTLERESGRVATPWGAVRRKQSEGYGVRRAKYEYDDLAAIARERDLSLRQAAAWVDEHR